MYQLMVKSNFSAAHQLREYKGKCEMLHGHNFEVQLMVCANQLDDIGLAIDFGQLKNILNEILGELDHCFLNEHPGFKTQNPSSENLARYIFQKVEHEIDSKDIKVDWVRVWESKDAYAQFIKNE